MTKSSAGASVVPFGVYQPWVLHDGLLYISGLTPRVGSEMLVSGRVGVDVSIEEARIAALLIASRILVCMREAAGDLDSIAKILTLDVYIASSPAFRDHSRIADFVSAALVEALGERAVGTRAAIGVESLPGNAPIEVKAIAVLRQPTSDRIT